MRNDTTKGQLDLLLLSLLGSGPGHGYELITRLRASSSGVFDLPEGTVYPALHRLEAAGLAAAGRETVAGRSRRVYTLTPAGRAELAAQTAQWQEHRDAVGRVLDGGGAARIGFARIGFARIGFARIGFARIGFARIGFACMGLGGSGVGRRGGAGLTGTAGTAGATA